MVMIVTFTVYFIHSYMTLIYETVTSCNLN